MTSQEIDDLKLLLRRMQQEDPHYRVFGAAQHHYCLGPTLTEAELTAFEQKHGIILPPDYRTFLAEAGNGGLGPDNRVFMGKSGAGPFYGLLALEDAAQDCNLGAPFPFTEATEALSQDKVRALINPDNFPGVPGALALCHRGCGLVFFLVVNGPAYGMIWEGREDFYPMFPSFDAWFGAWAKRLQEHALLHLANERRIEAAHVGMTKDEITALCGGEWELKPFYGKKSFLRFKHLSTQFEVADGVVTRIISHSIYC